jgi:hypothetical protein
MVEILLISYIVALIIVYLAQRGRKNGSSLKVPMVKRPNSLSVLDGLVLDAVNVAESQTFLDGRKLSWDEIKGKVYEHVVYWAKSECKMNERELDAYLEKQIRKCTNAY